MVKGTGLQILVKMATSGGVCFPFPVILPVYDCIRHPFNGKENETTWLVKVTDEVQCVYYELLNNLHAAIPLVLVPRQSITFY